MWERERERKSEKVSSEEERGRKTEKERHTSNYTSIDNTKKYHELETVHVVIIIIRKFEF